MITTFDVEMPQGTLRGAATDDGLALVALPQRPLEPELSRLAAGETVRHRQRHAAATELRAYVRGDLRAFTIPLDYRLTSGFRRRVLEELERVPYGDVVTYGELAARAGSPGASRAVGGAMGSNPLSIVVP